MFRFRPSPSRRNPPLQVGAVPAATRCAVSSWPLCAAQTPHAQPACTESAIQALDCHIARGRRRQLTCCRRRQRTTPPRTVRRRDPRPGSPAGSGRGGHRERPRRRHLGPGSGGPRHRPANRRPPPPETRSRLQGSPRTWSRRSPSSFTSACAGACPPPSWSGCRTSAAP